MHMIKNKWDPDKIKPFLVTPIIVIIASCLAIILFALLGVLFGGGLIAREFWKQIVSAGYSLVPFCIGIIGTFVLIRLLKLDVGLLVREYSIEVSHEGSKDKLYWIESLDPGLSGALLGFLLFLLPVVSHIVL